MEIKRDFADDRFEYPGYLRDMSLDLFLVCTGREHEKNSPSRSESGEYYVIHFITSGKGVFSVEGKTWDISEGQMFLSCPGESGIYVPDRENPWDCMWVGLGGIGAELVLRGCGFTRKSRVRKFSDLTSVTEKINNILAAKVISLSDNLRRDAYLRLLMADLTESYNEELEHSGMFPITGTYVERAMEYIRTEYQEGISVSDIAAYTGISRTYLNNIFQKEIGISVQKFLMDYRLHKAAALLLSTPNPVKDVAKAVGYEDSLGFSKVFKKKFGLSPRDYRQSRIASMKKIVQTEEKSVRTEEKKKK